MRLRPLVKNFLFAIFRVYTLVASIRSVGRRVSRPIIERTRVSVRIWKPPGRSQRHCRVSSSPFPYAACLIFRAVILPGCGTSISARPMYIGADIIRGLILSHQRLHATNTRRFMVLDIVADDLPQADLIMCRDCLVHFSYRLIRKALRNIRCSQSTYLLTTTFPEHSNSDIVTGNWRPLNLCRPPFDFPPPIRLINEATRPRIGTRALVCGRFRRYQSCSLHDFVPDSLGWDWGIFWRL